MSFNNTNDTLQGWTSSPEGRGTLDIIWSCSATIFLSTWSAICLNVPNPSDTVWTYFKRKTWITFISLMGPEYLLGYSLGEWQSARASVKYFKQLRQDGRWTMRHGFFADMGGFTLQTRDNIRFFLDTKCIIWMLERRAISLGQFEQWFLLDKRIIEDLNKSDTFVRVLAVCQALWFCINITARGLQGLAVTTLEVTTIGLIVDSVLVYYVWKDKPHDVGSSITIELDLTIDELLLLEEDEELRNRPYFRTPLDFTSREVWAFNLFYHYLMNIVKSMRPLKEKRPSLGRRSENDVLPIKGFPLIVSILATFAFMGTNFIAWNFHFPTPIEGLLWQISSCGLVGIAGVGLPLTGIMFSEKKIQAMQRRTEAYRQAHDESSFPGEAARLQDRLLYRLRSIGLKLRNNSREKDPNLDVSLLVVFFVVPGFAIYAVFRLYIIVEDIISFRALPASAYSTVDWWQYVPAIS